MAHGKQTRVYLGYEDEPVTEKYRSEVNFTTNKIGGTPDWHNEKCSVSAPQCRLCGLHQILVLQIYAPLENSKYHRTLYIFACINPNCWNQNESWTCLRVQSLEEDKQTYTGQSDDTMTSLSATSWLADADDWGDTINDNNIEQNGNNMLLNSKLKFSDKLQEDDLNTELAELRVSDPNANSPASMDSPVGVGAVGRLDSPLASAEIEGAEGEVVCIDTPTEPQCDLIQLLQEVTPLPVKYAEKREQGSLFFTEIFISVEPENLNEEVPQHVHDLFLKYQKDDKDWLSSTKSTNTEESKGALDSSSLEKYEKSNPMHGDKTFHEFVSRIKKNPGQILRYSRDNNAPLLLYSISGCVGRCRHCGDEMTFELQVLPSLIPKLRFNSQGDRNFQIEFGTVLIYTCVRSCWSQTDSYREEHAIVQAERL